MKHVLGLNWWLLKTLLETVVIKLKNVELFSDYICSIQCNMIV